MNLIDTIKRFFKKDDDDVGEIQFPTPEPETAIVEKDPWEGISEPVISFVECVKNNPKRFKMSRLLYKNNKRFGSLLDTYSNERFQFNLTWIDMFYNIHDSRSGVSLNVTYPEFLTWQEEKFLLDNISPIFNSRRLRLNELKEKRKMINNQRERDRLKEVYCDNRNN